MFSHDSGLAQALLCGVAVALLIGVYRVIRHTSQLLGSAKTQYLKSGALDLNPETGSTVSANRNEKRLTYNSHTLDWSGKFTSVYEYRLRGAIVEVRLIDDVSKWTDNTTENVRDGVVMEAVVARFPIAYLRDQRLAEFKANVEWHALESWRVRYYVLAQHPEEVPRSEVRRAVREDMERDRRMVERVCAAARGMGFPVSETDEGYQVERHPNDCHELGERLASACKAAGLAEGLSGLHRVTNAKAISRDYEALLI